MLHPHSEASKPLSRSGFALVIALGVMAFVVLLLLSITTFVRVESQLAHTHMHQLQAKQAALLSLHVALGELQQSAGPDQRISATADVLSSTHPSRKQHTGIWISDPNGAPGLAEGDLVRWLVSDFESVNDNTLPAPTTGAVTLVGAGSLADSNNDGIVDDPDARVAVTPTKIGGNQASAQYAWWIGDEGVKARINFAGSTGDALPAREAKQNALQILSSSARGNVATLPGLAAIDLQSGDLASKLLNVADMALAASAPDEEDIKALFHDLTTYSSGVLADPRNGGLKQDLSLAFELSDDDFYYSAFGSGGPSTILSPGFGRVQPIFRLPNTTNVLANGPAWHLLRDYYTIYQRMITPMTNPIFNAQTFTPNRLELPKIPGMPAHHHEDLPIMRYVRTGVLAMGFQGDPLRTNGGTQPIPVKASYLPYVQRHLTVVGIDFAAEPAPTPIPGQPDPNPNNYEFRRMRHLISPTFIVHNPYNVSIHHNGIVTGVNHIRFATKVESRVDQPYFLEINRELHAGNSNYDPNLGRMNSSGSGHMLKVSSGTIQAGAVQVYSGVRNDGNVYSPAGPSSLSNEEFWQADAADTYDLIIPVDPAAPNDPNVKVYYMPWSNHRWPYFMYHTIAVPGVDPPVASNLRGWQVGQQTAALSNYGGQHSDNIFLTYNNWYGGEDSDGRTINSEAYRREYDAAPFPFLNYDFFLKPAESDNVTNPFPYPGLTHTNPLAPIIESRNLFPTSDAKPNYGWPKYAPNWQLKVYTTAANVPGMDALQTSGDNSERAFWGASNEAGGTNFVAAIELPTRPPISIGQLQHANISIYQHMPALAIGNSFASAFVPRADTYQIYQNRAGYDRIFYDLSYLSNEALWDRFFFSSYSRAYNASGDNYNGTPRDSFDIAFDPTYSGNSSLNSLPNPRMELVLQDETIDQVKAKLFNAASGLPLDTAYQRAAENLMVKGSFNVHSTSVNAWRTILASARDLSIYRSGQTGTSDYTQNQTPLTRLQQPTEDAFESASDSYDDDTAWGGFATLTDAQLGDLATAIVAEIKLRVDNQGTIFTSLSAFVNRSLTNDNFGLAGLLQAAIDKSGINAAFSSGIIEVDSADLQGVAGDFPVPTNIRDGDGQARSTATTATANLTQADLLQALGSFASVRSDTFRIRAYGESLDPISGKSNGRAWCEAIVQRIPKPVEPGATSPSDPAYWEPQSSDGPGRKFEIIHFRWLSEDEI